MLIYLKANMAPQGELADAILQTHRELYRGREGPVIGMNWIRSWNAVMRKTIIWHNGETGGFHSYLAFSSDGQVGVVILANVANEAVDELGVHMLEDMRREASERDYEPLPSAQRQRDSGRRAT